MNLKRLEMIGFKSFADKTVIHFQDGVTGIVGPNGSGKSNIADAIRWVLGEQRSKQLRGSNMQDVIFKGTQERQALSYCEVTLVFDNTSHIFNTEYEEISISRKLYRSGDSEYLINKTPVRLKDITNLLHDVGIGKDGYFIIGQNRVSDIVQGKPLDRRKIFEEAAGVAQFKQSRHDSQNKLAKTRENLNICQNVLAEIESHIEPLKRQSTITQKYFNLKERLKILEINNYIYQYDNANDMKSKIQIRINALTEDIKDKTRSLNETIKKNNDNNNAIMKIDSNVNKLYDKKSDLLVAKEKNSGETKLLKERQKTLVDEIDRINGELANSNNMLENEQAELVSVEKEIENLKQKIQELNNQIGIVTSEYSVILDELTKSELGSVNSQKDMIDALNQLSDTREDLAKLTSEETSLKEQNQQAKEDLNQISTKYSQTKSQEVRLTESVKLLKNNHLKMKEQEKDLNELITLNTNKINEIEKTLSENIKKITSMESRHKLLSDLERDFNGYNNGVTSILKASKFNKDIKDHLIGVVANMITVPQEYRTAIETALGSNVQNIIVENEDDAEHLIQFLKYNRYGQATFFPLSSAKPRKLNSREINSFDMKGCLGIASDLITYDPKIDSVVKTLLGRIVICQDIHVARTLAKLNGYNFRTVTLDGDQTFTNGALSGGSQKSNVSHVLNREKDIEDLKNQLIELKALDDKKKKERETLRVDLDDYNRKIRTVRIELQNLEINIAKNEESLQSCKLIGSEQKSEMERLTEQVSQTNKRLTDLSTQISIMKMQEQNLSSNRNMATESMELTQKQSGELKIEKEKYQEKISNFKIQISETNAKISANQDTILRLNNSIAIRKSDIEGLTQTRELRIEDREEVESQIAHLQNTRQYIEIDDELEKVKQKLAYFETFKRQLQEETAKLEEDRMQLSATISSLTEKKNQEEINKAKVDMDLENMEKRVWEGYELTYGTCQEFKVEDYNVEKGITDAQNCRRDIDRLGNVNLNAIEELKEQQEKYNDMYEKIEDLLKAEQETTQIIDKLSKQMKSKFDEEFNKINENFSMVFTELFGGGKAKLVLTESETDDPLEQGVDIIAEPPGKKFANISLFSGGEQALTAIAILFAILKLRSMPFVVLDEVEAALDEMNVTRFAKYLNRFSKSTQFIVVTHRKPTMEQVDRLCGVTIQHTVSIIVNIALSDAIKIVDEDNKKLKG
ncbi:MAG: chromosome segregation protein SMC [Clostridia bacterium]|nr:chromosome segregation protein SMC [Clostridia bacterium]